MLASVHQAQEAMPPKHRAPRQRAQFDRRARRERRRLAVAELFVCALIPERGLLAPATVLSLTD